MAASSEPQDTQSEVELDKVEAMFKDKGKISEILSKMSKDTKGVSEAIGKLNDNNQFKRRTNRIAHERKDQVTQQVRSMPIGQQKKLKAQAERFHSGRDLSDRPSLEKGGVFVVSITASRQYKSVIMEPEFQKKDFYAGWICEPLELGEGLAIFFNPAGRTKNRLASKIRGGKPTSNDALILKINPDGEGGLLQLSLEEVAAAYPLR